MKRFLLCALSLAFAPTLAAVQSPPGRDALERQIIHWTGPEVAKLQQDATDLAVQARARPIVLPFDPAKAGACHIHGAVLIIGRDGVGEFNATTYTDDARSGAVWHTNISIYDNQNQLLFETGDFAGPVMDSAKPKTPYRWINHFTADQPTIDKLYNRIDHAALSYRC
jgi:hypothetical protein